MVKQKYITSSEYKHNHTWRWGDKKTSIDMGHSHPLNFNKMLAEKGRSDHIHKLLKTKVKGGNKK